MVTAVFRFMSKFFTRVTSDLSFKVAVLLFVIHFAAVEAAFVRRVCIPWFVERRIVITAKMGSAGVCQVFLSLIGCLKWACLAMQSFLAGVFRCCNTGISAW